MIESLIITLRETLEAALIAGIVLAYLNKGMNYGQKKYVWYGVGAGVVVSLVLAYVFQNFLGGFEGRAEELYEGGVMLFAAVLLTWMILWMLTQRHKLKGELEGKVKAHLEKDYPWGIFALVFVGVAREGIETVIFLEAALVRSDAIQVFGGGLIGIVVAIILSYLLFKGIAKIPLRPFFTFSSVILILFAAGLVAHGVHELQEAGALPVYAEHIWDTNSILNEDGAFGAFAKGLFGYNGNPNLLEVIAYAVYLVFIAGMWYKIEK